ncbi:MAG: VOC family protein [Anaerolineae bacterium]|nr:VOC family protein [Anaerolineae bacterium]
MTELTHSNFKIRATPNLRVRDAASAITFYQQAFGAVELRRLTDPDGKVVNALLSIGEALFVVAEESPKTGSPSPQTLGGSPVSIDLSVPDVDVTVNQAVAAGAVVQYPVMNQFYGLRQGRIVDPFGHMWNIDTPIEEVSPAEMQRRLDEMMKSADR